MQPLSFCIYLIFIYFFYIFISFYYFLSKYLSIILLYMSTYLSMSTYLHQHTYLSISTHLPAICQPPTTTTTNLNQHTDLPTYLYQHNYPHVYFPTHTNPCQPTYLYQSLNINIESPPTQELVLVLFMLDFLFGVCPVNSHHSATLNFFKYLKLSHYLSLSLSLSIYHCI